MSLRNGPSFHLDTIPNDLLTPVYNEVMQPLHVNIVDKIPDLPDLKTPELLEGNTKNLEQIKENIDQNFEDTLEAVLPRGLKKLDQNTVNSAINHNHFARKHLNSERIHRAHNAIDFLVKKGMPIHVAVGIVANGIAESGLDTTKKPSGLGLFQWIGPREKKFHQIQSKLDGVNDFEKQLSFMMWELENTETKAGNRLKTARTAQEASRIFLVDFERPKIKNIEERSAITTGLLQITHNNMHVA